jgi:hypothetical protein
MAEATLKHRGANKKMLYLIEQYKQAHPDEGFEVSPHLVAEWAVKEGLWKRPPMTAEEVLRRQLSSALRTEYIIDPQGREVRANHPVLTEVSTSQGVKRRSKWYRIFDAPPKMMRASLQLRRKAALADVIQLKFDFESYNDNNVYDEQLDALDFNFNKDIEEMNMPTVYEEDFGDEEDEDDDF